MLPFILGALGAIAIHKALTPEGQRDGVIHDYHKGKLSGSEATVRLQQIYERECDLMAANDEKPHHLTGDAAIAFRNGLTPKEINEAVRTGKMNAAVGESLKDAYYHTTW